MAKLRVNIYTSFNFFGNIVNVALPTNIWVYINSKVSNAIFFQLFSCTKQATFQAISFQFCARESESLYHLFYFCPFSKTFWSDFESFWHLLKKEMEIIQLHVSVKDIIVQLVTTKPLLKKLNALYFSSRYLARNN